METTNNNPKNFVDLMIESQSNVVDQMIDTTKKLAKDVPFVNETLDKGHQFYKEALKNTSDFVDKTSKSIKETTTSMNENSEKAKNYFEQWFENQMNWAKTVFNTNNTVPSFSQNPADWVNQWQNWVNQSQNHWMNSLNQNPYAQMMNSNPYSFWQSKFNGGLHDWSQYTKQYFDLLSTGNGEWWKNFSNLTAADSFKGMNQMNESLKKFYELWIPMFKNIQEKNFNTEIFRNHLNPEKYKEFVDRFFNFMPDNSRKMMEQFNQQFVQSMKQISESGLNNYFQFKSHMQNNPWMNSNPLQQILEMYINWKSSMNEAVSPLSRLVEENGNVKQVKIWNDIYDQMVQYNIKNNELQLMMYKHGLKVMDNVAEKVAIKIQKGENIDSIIKIFQDWLMTGDEIYGNLFESDEYSKLMTEVNSLQLKIKQQIDTQMEKMFFIHMPLATRSEMDEVYKNIYDLKKMVRNLEKMMTNDKSEEIKASRKK